MWVFESHACFRILGTHFITKCSQQEKAGRPQAPDLEPAYLEQTENIQKQNQSHGLAWKNKHTPPPPSYFSTCTPGKACFGRIWKGGEIKALRVKHFCDVTFRYLPLSLPCLGSVLLCHQAMLAEKTYHFASQLSFMQMLAWYV